MHFCPSHETFPICLSSSPHQKTGAAVSSSRLFFHVMHSRRQPARSPTPLRTSRIIQGAELLPYQTREPRGLSPSGGNSAANRLVPLRPCAPAARSPGSRAARGRRKAGCPWDNPVCLWQTELFKFYLKSSPSPSGHNRRRRSATDSCQSKQGFGTAVPKTTIEVADHCPLRVCTGQPAFRRPDRRAVAPVVPRR